MYGRTTLRRPEKCAECQAELIRTSEMYLCCPNGHGKLVSNFAGRYGTARREIKAPAVAWGKAVKAYDRAAKKLADWVPSGWQPITLRRATAEEEATGTFGGFFGRPVVFPAEPAVA